MNQGSPASSHSNDAQWRPLADHEDRRHFATTARRGGQRSLHHTLDVTRNCPVLGRCMCCDWPDIKFKSSLSLACLRQTWQVRGSESLHCPRKKNQFGNPALASSRNASFTFAHFSESLHVLNRNGSPSRVHHAALLPLGKNSPHGK